MKRNESRREQKKEEQLPSSKRISEKCAAEGTDSSLQSSESPEETGKVRALISRWQKLTEKDKAVDKGSENIEIGLAESAVQNATIFPAKDDTDKVNAIQRVFSDLVEYMEPTPILDRFMTSGLFKISQIRDIMDRTSTSDKTRELLKRVMQRGEDVYTKLKKYLNETNQGHLVKLLEMTERRENTTEIRKEISRTYIATSNFPHRVATMAPKEMQSDLINCYRKYHSKISVSPLFKEHDVTLEEFYVKPPMEAIDLPFRYGDPTKTPTKTPVKSYKQLLFKDNGSPYTNIYVTADAGVGKTAFTQKLCALWCQAHSPMTSLASKYDDDDILAARYFEFLFLIPLRDADRSLCDLDEQIVYLIKKNIDRRHSREMIDQILEESSCIIIIDGLDEWSHSEACSRRLHDHDIPEIKQRPNCTILSTTRPWKYDLLNLASDEVDRHVEIKGLDQESSKQLVSNAVYLLNQKLEYGRPKKSVEDFYQTTSSMKLGDIRQVPYIYLQSVCLWFDGNDIGGSKCAVYTNLMELTLERGIQKMKSGTRLLEQQEDSGINVPICMIGKTYCIQHLTLLLKLGKLAFFTLFGTENRQLLVFDVKFAEKYLTIKELEFCLQLGILSRNKGYGLVATKISNLSFQHKSMHEFFTALYMQSHDTNSSKQQVQDIVGKTCTTLSSILEMSNVFIFLSGLGPTLYSDLSHTIMKYVTLDKETRYYRKCNSSLTVTTDSVYNGSVKFQTLQVDCLEEMLANGHDFHSLPIEDVVIIKISMHTEYLSALQKILHGNKIKIKSLSILKCKNTEEVANILETLDVQNFRSLDKIGLAAVVRMHDVEQLLSKSISTLQYLCFYSSKFESYRFDYEITVLSKESVDMIVSMPLLQGLCLESHIVTHDQLENLAAFLNLRVTMTQIDLERISCSDHKESCPGIDFRLSGHKNLQVLGLNKMPVSKLEVNTQHLEELYIGECPPGMIEFDLKHLAAANSLRILGFEGLSDTLIPIITELLQLERILIYKTDLTDNSFVTTDMTRLYDIILDKVSMTSSALRSLICTVNTLSRSVFVKLADCTVIPQVEYETVKNEIRRSASVIVTKDDTHFFYYRTREKKPT